MTKELKSIEVFAEDYERYMAICEVYSCFTPADLLGYLLSSLNYPSAEEIRKKKV